VTDPDVRLERLIDRAGELRAELLEELRRFLAAHPDQPRTGRAGDTRLALSTAAEFSGRCVEALTALRASRASVTPAATSATSTERSDA
jgi:hypothetical protein